MDRSKIKCSEKIQHKDAFCTICFLCFGCYQMPFFRITKENNSLFVCNNCYGKFEDIDMYRTKGYFDHRYSSDSKAIVKSKESFMFPNFNKLIFEYFENHNCCSVYDVTPQK